MSTPLCPGCGQGSQDWLLCESCTLAVVAALTLVIPTAGEPGPGLPWESPRRAWAGIEAELTVSLARQGRHAPNTAGGRASSIPLPYDQGASDRLANLRAVLVTWVRVLEQGQDWPADDLVSIARWLITRRDRIRAHVAAEQVVSDISRAIGKCMSGIDRPAMETAPSPAQVGRRERQLLEVLDALATRTEILAALPDAYNLHVSAPRFSNWLARGRITPHGSSASGHAMYRVGDVVDLARACRTVTT